MEARNYGLVGLERGRSGSFVGLGRRRSILTNQCALGGRALLVAATALRATHYRCLPSGNPNPYSVFGLNPEVPTARDPALIESCYRQASDLLDRQSRNFAHPCFLAFTIAARLVADAWGFLSDADRKASLDSRYTTQVPEDDDDGDQVMIVERPAQRSVVGTTSGGGGSGASRKTKEPASPNANEGKKLGKKLKQEHVVEGEVTEKARASQADDFSIKKCISLVNTIEELSGVEKAEAFDVLKDAQNREIFVIAEPIARLIWLRKKMQQVQG